ncbi:hypothetical protein [Actinoplanes sp. NPDC051851]|uniref:hypothetical protein n=1 Tax=Actinoplanes sp. NPDC051851 TaxID=3154753 RepID=UPI003432359C
MARRNTRSTLRRRRRTQDGTAAPRGEKRRRLRVIVFAVVMAAGSVGLLAGQDLQTVCGIGLAATAIARWLCDDDPLPGPGELFGRLAGGGDSERAR